MTRFRDCTECGRPFRGRLEKCLDCRLGRRRETLEYRKARREPRASRTLRQWRQNRKERSA